MGEDLHHSKPLQMLSPGRKKDILPFTSGVIVGIDRVKCTLFILKTTQHLRPLSCKFWPLYSPSQSIVPRPFNGLQQSLVSPFVTLILWLKQDLQSIWGPPLKSVFTVHNLVYNPCVVGAKEDDIPVYMNTTHENKTIFETLWIW